MVQNQTIEGFDAFLETHRKELQEKILRDPQSIELQTGYDAEEIMLEHFDLEVNIEILNQESGHFIFLQL